MTTLHFLGPSGSGKDTQVELLKDRYDFESIGSGDMLRKMFNSRDSEAIEAQKYWGAGKWVPDKLMAKMYDKWLEQFKSKDNWAFISFVRRKSQIQLLDGILQNEGRKLDYFIHLELDETTAVKRMSARWVCPVCGTNYNEETRPELTKGFCDKDNAELIKRSDDTSMQKIHNRLQEYKDNINPILEEYKKRGILINIDGSKSIEDVHSDIKNAIRLI